MMILLPPTGSIGFRFRRLAQNWRVGLGAATFFSLSIGGISGADGNQPEERLKYEEPKSLTAAIYERGSERQKPLFAFKRQVTRAGLMLRVVRDFTYPDGKEAAREEAVYEENNLLSFVLREAQSGAMGSAKIRRSPGQNDGRIEFEYVKSAGGALKTRTEALRENTLIADMVPPFLADHWDALMHGQKVKCRVIVVERLETVGFTFLKEAGSEAKDGEEVSIKMEPTSRIIAAIVDPLYFKIEKAPPHRVLEYNGRTTPKLNARGKWEDLDAVTVFSWR